MNPDRALTVLDCTLRDGGYYNAWQFDRGLVDQYVSAAASAGVDAVEIGFRQPPTGKFLGPFAYSSDRYLDSLDVPDGFQLAVMSDAKVLLRDGDPCAAVDALYAPKGDSRVDIVRLASMIDELPKLGPAVPALRAKGYRVCVNVMQMGGKPLEAVSEVGRTAAGLEGLDVLYFADSFGSMDPETVRGTISALREHWIGPIGIHTHDNMNLALANSLAAIDAGATWVDGTVLGMGRGAGNVAMEYLLHTLQERGHARYRPEALLHLLVEGFMPLRQRYGWGPSLLYYLAAQHEIHPTYLQRLQEPGQTDLEALVNALDYLRESSSSAFSEETLGRAMRADQVDVAGAWSPRGWAADRDVLLVANGASAREHRDALERFIHASGPRVVALNHVEALPPGLVDAYAICHPMRLIQDVPAYRQLTRPLVLPMDPLAQQLSASLGPERLLDFGFTVRPGTLSIRDTGCAIPSRKVAPYALALAAAAGARRVFLAGFDGFEASDPRQQEMNELFDLFRRTFPGIEVIALTPTRFNVTQSSVYAY